MKITKAKKKNPLKSVLDVLTQKMNKLMMEPHPAEVAPKNGYSPISFVPTEVLRFTIQLGISTEKQRLLLSRVNKRFYDLIKNDGRLLLQSKEVLEEIGDTPDQKAVDDLFNSQTQEIDYLLDKETSIYNKNQAQQKTQTALDELKKLPQTKDFYSVYIRHKALNHINTCIILNCLHFNRNDNIALCADSHITRFPSKLLNDPKLEEYWSGITILDLEHNRLTRLPGSICKLSNLRQLWLSHNQLQELPQPAATIPTLKQIKARNNFIRSIENFNFAAMVNLESLILNDNALQTIPAQLAKLPRLKTLHITGNDLSVLPDSLPDKLLIMSENGETHYVSKEKILASQHQGPEKSIKLQ